MLKRRLLSGVLTAIMIMMGGAAFADEAPMSPKLTTLLETYKQTGEMVNCLGITRIHDTDVLDDQHIVFYMQGGDVYLNSLPNRCRGLGFSKAFGYKTSGSELCNVDMIRVIDNSPGGGARGACGLGQYEKLEKK